MRFKSVTAEINDLRSLARTCRWSAHFQPPLLRGRGDRNLKGIPRRGFRIAPQAIRMNLDLSSDSRGILEEVANQARCSLQLDLSGFQAFISQVPELGLLTPPPHVQLN